MKLDILAIGVHPDDIEISCSGTVLKHIDQGKKVGILDMTEGELGTRGDAPTRLKEAEAAAKILGVEVRDNLGFADGFFQNDKKHQVEIVKKIRQYQPDIVLANAVHDRHPDHGRAAKLVADSCFLAGLVKIATTIDGKKQQEWRPKAVYHYIQDYMTDPDFVIDISPYFEKKIESIRAFKSQFYNPESTEPETPISSKEFLEFLRGRARNWGRPIGAQYAEAYTVNRTLGVDSLFDLV